MKDDSRSTGMSSFGSLQKAQSYIMILMVPFLVVFLIAMAVVCAIHMPYLLVSYPIAGAAIMIYRKMRKRNQKEEIE
jgi:hypothetical protein